MTRPYSVVFKQKMMERLTDKYTLNRGMSSIEKASNLIHRIAGLPAIPHQVLLLCAVVNPRSLLHMQHRPLYS
jgi:hypothetical protein